MLARAKSTPLGLQKRQALLSASPASGAIRVSGMRPCELLAPIYGWFTEGFDTLDLKEAKVLLDDPAA